MSTADLDIFLSGGVYLAAVFLLFFIGKLVYDKTHPRLNLRRELFENDNFALSLSVVGYYAGLVFALGGVLAGEGVDLLHDLFDIGFFGLAAIILLNLSSRINDRLILSKFDNQKEILEDRNAGTGAVEAGNHIANGLIISGAVSGANTDLILAVSFWALGQVAMVVISAAYIRLVGYDFHDEIERDNVAVGVALCGLLIALGNIIRLSVSGDFHGWSHDITNFFVYTGVAVVLLPLLRFLTDWLLLPGVKLSDELIAKDDGQEMPNVGAGLIEAFSYIAGSLLVGWAIFST